MQQILKRLELIKTALSIDDEEIVDLQIAKLNNLTIDGDVSKIIKELKENKYVSALKNINNYLKRFSGVTVFVDETLQALKLELKALEKNFQLLNEKKQEYIHTINEFNTLYSIKLGKTIEEILHLKEKIAKQDIEKKTKLHKQKQQNINEIKENIEELETTLDEIGTVLHKLKKEDPNYDEIYQTFTELQNEFEDLQEVLQEQEEELTKEERHIKENFYQQYKQTKNEYKEFQKEYEDTKKEFESSFKLSKNKKKELKKLWKKASRLCHPDIVTDELQAQATMIMQQLNEAYAKKDLIQIQKIYNNLQDGIAFELSSDKLNDTKLIKAKISQLKNEISQLEEDINALEQDETMQVIQNIDDWDEYFENIQQQLQEELEALQNIFNQNQQDEVVFEDDLQENIIEDIEEKYKALYEITNISFEKVRRFYANLVKQGNGDTMAKEFNEKAKLYKALVYDALEQFMYELTCDKLSIIEWGCSQGIGTALMLDYIKEKQLNIKVQQVILIDDDKKALSRAKLHCDILKQNKLDIIIIDAYNSINKINEIKKGFTLNLFIHDKDIIDWFEIDFERFVGDYFICISDKSDEVIESITEQINSICEINYITNRHSKIGRFEKYEKIFKISR